MNAGIDLNGTCAWINIPTDALQSHIIRPIIKNRIDVLRVVVAMINTADCYVGRMAWG